MLLDTQLESSDLGYDELPQLLQLMPGDEKHEPAALSTLDVIWVLYDRVLRINPAAPELPDRDRFFLSKGHGPMAYYAVLAAKGFFPLATLRTYGAYDSPLGLHPDRLLVPGVECSSGSLGHGLAIAVGSAFALRLQGRNEPHVFCLLGDAELDEGSNHEAIAFAGRMRLANLTAIVIDNSSASLGWPGGIAARFAGERWQTTEVDGRDHQALERAFTRTCKSPHAIVAAVEMKV